MERTSIKEGPIGELNRWVDEIYVINLNRRPDRWSRVKSRLEHLNLSAIRWPAVDGWNLPPHGMGNVGIWNQGSVGALKSHRAVLEDALNKNFNSILVLEDDVIFSNSIEIRLKSIATSIPLDWDVFYLGCHWFGSPHPPFISDQIIDASGVQGMFGAIIKNTAIRKLFNETTAETYPIDRHLSFLTKSKSIKAYGIYPFVVGVEVGFSDIGLNDDPYPCVNDHFDI